MLSSKLIKCLKKTGSMKLQLKVATTNQAFDKKKPSYFSSPQERFTVWDRKEYSETSWSLIRLISKSTERIKCFYISQSRKMVTLVMV